MTSIPFLTPRQTTTPQRAWIVTVDADLPGLHLKSGDVLAVWSQDRWDCDSLYQTVTGDIVRIQALFDGTFAITTPDGQRNIVPKADLEGLICGWVKDAAESMEALMRRMRW